MSINFYKYFIVMGWVLLLVGCDALTKNNSEENPINANGNGIIQTQKVQFEPDNPTIGNNAIYMQYNLGKSNEEIVYVNINAKDISNLFGAVFELDFDPSVIAYENMEKGNLLGNESEVNYEVGFEEGSNNKLLVGVTRLGKIETISGSGTILTLEFKVKGSGNNKLSFTYNQIRDNKNSMIPNVSWLGGTLKVL